MSILVDTYIKPYTTAIGAVIVIALVAWWSHFMYSSGANSVKVKYDEALVKEKNAYIEELDKQNKKYKLLQDQFAVIDQDLTKRLAEARNENEKLRTAVANGRVGLRVPVVCKTPTLSYGQTATADTSADSGGTAELAESARPTYFALREGISKQYEQLKACQALLKQERE